MEEKQEIAHLIERLRLFEVDHTPDGWPAVQMRDITTLLDQVERLRDGLERVRKSDYLQTARAIAEIALGYEDWRNAHERGSSEEIEGGWTARKLDAYAKSLEQQIDALKTELSRLKTP